MKEIRNIIRQYDQMDWSRDKAALATVVSVEESSYRRIGARMFVKSSGDWIGGISGGCLEGDALRRAQTAIYKNEPSVVVYDTLEDDDHQIGVGLGCNGRIEVLFVPIDQNDPNNPVEVLRRQLDRRQPGILIQAIGREKGELNGKLYESSQVGEMSNDLAIAGSILEEAIDRIQEKGKSKVLPLKSETGESIDILFEWLRPEMRLIIVGDNYDVNALVGIVHELGWEMHLVGTLRKFHKSIFDLAASVQHYTEVDKLELDDHTCLLLMSHDYKKDMQMIRHFLPLNPVYVGMLGPKKRMIKMHNELQTFQPDIDLAGYPNLFAPIGLDIGAESPEEISLSIVSEIVSVFRDRDGKSLRMRPGTIHERESVG